MISKQGVLLHVGLLVVASGLGFSAITKDDEDLREEHETVLWSADADSITRIEFESAKQTVVLEGKKDDTGRYYVGTLNREKRTTPHNPHQRGDGDAGAPPVEEAAPEREVIRFIAVEQANQLAGNLATLHAKRSLGKLDPARYEEFEFSEKESAKIKVQLGGTEHELVLGGKTPGGTDIYVREAKSGEAYVVPGSIARDLSAAESSLVERDLLGFEQGDVHKVVIQQGEATRELVAAEGEKGFWASPSSPAAKDETASNWMTKLARVKINEYVESPGDGVTPLCEVRYFDKSGKLLGFLELASQALPNEDKPRYLARSPGTRWYGTVVASTAEQLSQDIASVLNP